MNNRIMIKPRFCYEPVLTWDPPSAADLPKGSGGPWYVPCKQPAVRWLTRPGSDAIQAVCYSHSPNAKRPRPAGR